MKKLVLSTVVGTLVATSAIAEEKMCVSPLDASRFSGTIGAGIGLAPDYKGSNDYEARLLPLININYAIDNESTVFIGGARGLGYARRINEQLTAGVKVGARIGRDSSDNGRLFGMDDIDTVPSYGVFADYKLSENVLLSADVDYADKDNNDGLLTTLAASYEMPLSERTVVNFTADLEYGNATYAQSQFGVKAADATARRSSFSADSGFHQVGVGASIRFQPSASSKGAFVMGAHVGELLGDAAESSLTDESTQFGVFSGYMWQF